MRRPIAIAIKRENAFASAAHSARNAGYALLDFMYGTPERVKVTMLFALGLALMGGVFYSAPVQPVCAI